jgi:hypothetical protein
MSRIGWAFASLEPGLALSSGRKMALRSRRQDYEMLQIGLHRKGS